MEYPIDSLDPYSSPLRALFMLTLLLQISIDIIWKWKQKQYSPGGSRESGKSYKVPGPRWLITTYLLVLYGSSYVLGIGPAGPVYITYTDI